MQRKYNMQTKYENKDKGNLICKFCGGNHTEKRCPETIMATKRAKFIQDLMKHEELVERIENIESVIAEILIIMKDILVSVEEQRIILERLTSNQENKEELSDFYGNINTTSLWSGEYFLFRRIIPYLLDRNIPPAF